MDSTPHPRRTEHPPCRHRHAILRAAAFATTCLVLAAPVRSDEDSAERIEQTRVTLEKWIETRRLIATEKRDWKLGRETMADRIEVVRKEIASLRERVGAAQESISETDAKTAELVERNESLKQASATLAGTVADLEIRTRTLLARLPDTLLERVKPLSQRFPEDSNDTESSLSERFQNVAGVLVEVNKFHREISLENEVRTLPDGSTSEVTTMYLGVGYAFYASANGEAAGIGTAGTEGWEWTSADEHAEAINKAIAILRSEDVASFVRLPIEIR